LLFVASLHLMMVHDIFSRLVFVC